MVFSSFQFLFVFLPAFLVGYALLPRTSWRNYFLLASSLLFYVWGEKGYVALLLLSITSTWAFGLWMGRSSSPRARSLILAGGVSLNLLILVYCKYLAFLAATVFALLALGGIDVAHPTPTSFSSHLPLGVSFFVFQAISYLVDIHRNEVAPQKSLLLFGMYKSSFPQLIAGPIVRYAQVQHEIEHRQFTVDAYSGGLWRFMIGLSQKILLANPCGAVADQVFNAPTGSYGAAAAWIGTIAYALQIYFDFCGYSNMAIGMGRMIGFTFPENFNRPYEAASMTDFWRRWHMSLSTWFRDYVYIPLGGNRISGPRTYLNLIVVFLLCGLWHGAAWSFVIWGCYHGVFLCLERTKPGRKLLLSAPRFIARVYVLIAILFSWVLFRATSLGQALDVASTMTGFRPTMDAAGAQPLSLYDILGYESMTAMAIALAIGLGAHRPVLRGATRLLNLASVPTSVRGITQGGAAVGVFLLSLAYAAGSTFNPFLYFRF